jgi:hypothetical protein
MTASVWRVKKHFLFADARLIVPVSNFDAETPRCNVPQRYERG